MFDAPEPQAEPAPALAVSPAAAKKDSHPGKKPVLIHTPETMHKDLRRLALEDGTPAHADHGAPVAGVPGQEGLHAARRQVGATPAGMCGDE